jgi:tRNA (guanine-N7-)-methyltransferase
MRLRRDPTAIQQLTTHPLVVMDVTSHRGNWKTMFPKSNPLYVELGTGKGQFIAKASTNYPNINWVGIDRIQEPLLHAVRQGEATGRGDRES